MYYSKVDICGIDTSKLRVLSDKEKRELLSLAKNGDENARNELIGGNLRLVLSIIQRFAGRKENVDDLFQVGCIGLIKAIDNFNTELDVKFSTYAVPMIIGEIKRHLRDNNSIRVSRSVRDLAYKALSAKEELTRKNGHEPSSAEITEALKKSGICCTVKDVSLALEAIVDPISLFDPVYSDGSSSSDTIFVMDQLSDRSSSEESWLESISLREAMKKLSKREKAILGMRFFSGRTQTEIASEIGISQAQVSRLEKSAIERIRKQLN